MAVIQSRGARIHWEQAGAGSPVLLIMGHLYSSAMWYPLLPELTKTHQAIWFDNRGTGDSDTTANITLEELASDALAVLDAAGIDKAHVYGVSMGGGIAAELAMSCPQRVLSLTLGCTMLKTEKTRITGLRRVIYNLPLAVARKLLASSMKPENYGSAAPLGPALHDIEKLKQDRFTMRGVKAQALAIANYATTHERAVERLRMPVLVLHGDEDTTVPVERGRELARIIPDSKYVEFKGASHNYLVAATAESTAAFLTFIDSVDSERTAR